MEENNGDNTKLDPFVGLRPVSMGFQGAFHDINIINFADMVRRENVGVLWDVRRVSSP